MREKIRQFEAFSISGREPQSCIQCFGRHICCISSFDICCWYIVFHVLSSPHSSKALVLMWLYFLNDRRLDCMYFESWKRSFLISAWASNLCTLFTSCSCVVTFVNYLKKEKKNKTVWTFVSSIDAVVMRNIMPWNLDIERHTCTAEKF